jgi:hypothetical protein
LPLCDKVKKNQFLSMDIFLNAASLLILWFILDGIGDLVVAVKDLNETLKGDKKTEDKEKVGD